MSEQMYVWYPDPSDYTDENEHACPFCDCDGYYRSQIDREVSDYE